jgi:hypothetical protein
MRVLALLGADPAMLVPALPEALLEALVRALLGALSDPAVLVLALLA